MSTGFRLFLLMVLAFAAIWVVQFRGGDLTSWLEAPARVQCENSEWALVKSPVDRAVGLADGFKVSYRGAEVLLDPGPVLDERLGPRHGSPFALYADPSPDFDPKSLESWPPDEPDGDFLDRDGGGGEVPPSDPAPPVDDAHDADPDPDDGESADTEPVDPAVDVTESPLRVYTVVKGDSLSRIARKLLGKEHRHQEIQELNKDLLKGSTVLQPGMILLIPAH